MSGGRNRWLAVFCTAFFQGCTPTANDKPVDTDTSEPDHLVDTGEDSAQDTGEAMDTGEIVDTGEPSAYHGTLAFEPINAQHLSFGATWCGFGFDGTQVVISTEQGGTIEAAPFSLDGLQVQHQAIVASPSDTLAAERITDHKHAFMGEHHYIVFSNEGQGSGGELILLKLTRQLERIDIVHVETNDPPTNDMLLVTDGETLSVGKFLPAVGHRIYEFDADLNLLDSVPIGDGDAMHANGAAAVFANGQYHLLAPMTLAPTVNRQFQHLVFDEYWGLVSGPDFVLERDFLGMVTALEFEEETGHFIAHFNEDTAGVGGNIHRLVYDNDWNLVDDSVVAEGEFARPHTVMVPGEIWLGYDADGEVWLNRFSMSVLEN